ncbi:hypothetical protein E4T56_gene14373, partial [Termitomyces sp. T112]
DAHPQKAEGPEHKVEDRGTQRDAAQIARITEPTDHRHIDHADQRHQRLSNDDRPGLSENGASGGLCHDLTVTNANLAESPARSARPEHGRRAQRRGSDRPERGRAATCRMMAPISMASKRRA